MHTIIPYAFVKVLIKFIRITEFPVLEAIKIHLYDMRHVNTNIEQVIIKQVEQQVRLAAPSYTSDYLNEAGMPHCLQF